MSFLKKIFAKKPSDSGSSATPRPAPAADSAPTPPPASAAPAAPPRPDPAQDPNLMRVVDAHGREMFITRQEWRDNVLLNHLEKVWADPEHLSATILKSLQDGFLTDMLAPAEQLVRIDPVPERAAVILSIVLRELKRPDESEGVLRRQIEQHGESGVVLVNLAKIQSERGEAELSLQTLWRALELDPNQENGFAWYIALHQEQGGADAALQALHRLAALPGCWRARLGLAREALGRRDLPAALAFCREAIALVGTPVPAELLVQLSSDLGQAGHLPELLELTAPHFDLAAHGLQVGNNLLKAHVDLGHFDVARALLDELYAQRRPDWRRHLDFWDTEIARARVVAARKAAAAQELSLAMLVDDGPVWLPSASPAAELFPAAADDAPAIAFLGSSVETPAAGTGPQFGDGPGRLSRALPLFLAEQVRFGSRARVRPIVPWARNGAPMFVVGRQPWSEQEASHHARTISPACPFVVVTHVRPATETWRVELRLIRTADAAVVGAAVAEFAIAEPEDALRGLAGELLALLQREAGVAPVSVISEYLAPTGDSFGHYLLRLEQVLSVRCYTLPGMPAGYLYGEREILDGLLQLCLAQPDNAVPRLMLAQVLQRLQPGRPQIVAEYREKVALLQKDKPLPAPATQAVLQRLLDAAFV